MARVTELPHTLLYFLEPKIGSWSVDILNDIISLENVSVSGSQRVVRVKRLFKGEKIQLRIPWNVYTLNGDHLPLNTEDLNFNLTQTLSSLCNVGFMPGLILTNGTKQQILKVLDLIPEFIPGSTCIPPALCDTLWQCCDGKCVFGNACRTRLGQQKAGIPWMGNVNLRAPETVKRVFHYGWMDEGVPRTDLTLGNCFYFHLTVDDPITYSVYKPLKSHFEIAYDPVAKTLSFPLLSLMPGTLLALGCYPPNEARKMRVPIVLYAQRETEKDQYKVQLPKTTPTREFIILGVCFGMEFYPDILKWREMPESFHSNYGKWVTEQMRALDFTDYSVNMWKQEK